MELDPKKLEKQNIEESLLQLNVILKELETDQQADESSNQKVHIEISNLNKKWDNILNLLSLNICSSMIAKY